MVHHITVHRRSTKVRCSTINTRRCRPRPIPNDGEDEPKSVFPWTIIFDGHHTVRAVPSVVQHIFSHVFEQQWLANVFKIPTTGHEQQQQMEAPFHSSRDGDRSRKRPQASQSKSGTILAADGVRWQQTVSIGSTNPGGSKGTSFKTLGQQFDSSDNRTHVWANPNHSKDRWPTRPAANPNPPSDITSRSSSPDQHDRVKQEKPIQTQI
ncbi:hypothetical protein ACLOJK_037564 [Asimina triloba]